MLKGRKIAVVVPCYNEGTQVAKVLRTIPAFVDHVIVVDDCSTDDTAAIVDSIRLERGPGSRIECVRNTVNMGSGGSILAGYRLMRDRGIDVTAVMDGDGQMDPGDLERIVMPVVEGVADYSKGNRLLNENSWRTIPRHRFLGNAVLSFLTKMVSGYWSVMDSQSGFTAISLEALKVLNLDRVYKRYGFPNDMLTRLNVYNFRLAQVPIEAVYNIGECSKMRMHKVLFTLPRLLFRLFFYRMFFKYVVRDFHPIFLFYMAGFLLFFAGAIGGIVTLSLDIMLLLGADAAHVGYGWMMFFTVLLIFGFNMLLFAMSMDRDENRSLQVTVFPDGRRV